MDIKQLLIRHEGIRLKPYKDTVGRLTIGVGRNLDDNGITQDEAMQMLNRDIAKSTAAASVFDWFSSLSQPRKDVVVSMIFNMGLSKFCEFKRLIYALESRDYEGAVNEMMNSRWAKQVGRRAMELADMMHSGTYPEF